MTTLPVKGDRSPDRKGIGPAAEGADAGENPGIDQAEGKKGGKLPVGARGNKTDRPPPEGVKSGDRNVAADVSAACQEVLTRRNHLSQRWLCDLKDQAIGCCPT